MSLLLLSMYTFFGTLAVQSLGLHLVIGFLHALTERGFLSTFMAMMARQQQQQQQQQEEQGRCLALAKQQALDTAGKISEKAGLLEADESDPIHQPTPSPAQLGHTRSGTGAGTRSADLHQVGRVCTLNPAFSGGSCQSAAEKLRSLMAAGKDGRSLLKYKKQYHDHKVHV